ncbi:MAG: DUF4270 family protein [Bacteroidetes bacterium]|nr:DUF4270 family protein [Bacteroidota bacterium]
MNTLYKISLSFSLGLLAVFFTTCKKDNTVLGTNIQPKQDALLAEGTIVPLFAHTVLTKTAVASFNDRYKFLGSNQDPYFGRTDIGLYTNFNIPDGIVGLSFPQNANLVSAEIILKADQFEFVGDTTSTQSFSVFTIDSMLYPTRVYYANKADSLAKSYNLVGSFTGAHTYYQGEKVIRIPINNAFANAIMSNPQFLTDNTTFLNAYKGFYITASGTSLNPVNSQGIIYKLDLEDGISGFYVYYTIGNTPAIKNYYNYKFVFSGSQASRFNVAKYLPQSGCNNLLYNQIFNNDTIVSASQNLFLKAFGSTKIRVQIPSLKSMADSFKVSVNRAEFSIYIDPSYQTSYGNSQYAILPQLALLPLDSLGNENYAIDQLSPDDLARYGGQYDPTNNRYVFNIQRQVQAILKGTKRNWGFNLVCANPNPILTSRRDNYIERVVFAGTANTTLAPRLILNYVKFRYD